MVPVILRKAVIIPKTRLTTTATNVQPGLKHLHDVDIKLHFPQHFMRNATEGESKRYIHIVNKNGECTIKCYP